MAGRFLNIPKQSSLVRTIIVTIIVAILLLFVFYHMVYDPYWQLMLTMWHLS